MDSEYERLRDMSRDDLWVYITTRDWGEKPCTIAAQIVKTARLVIRQCPPRTADVCRIMFEKNIAAKDAAYFRAEYQAIMQNPLLSLHKSA